MINPLDKPGEIFDLPLFNPNPSSSKTKDGPVYRVSFELEQDDWQMFMDANTKGMMIAAKACVVVQDEDQALNKPKAGKGPYGEQARALKLSGFFRRPEVWEAVGTDDDYQEWCRGQKCVVCGDGDYVEGEIRNQSGHVRRISEGAGVGIKPRYCAVPLCQKDHTLEQHQHGETAAYRRHLMIKTGHERQVTLQEAKDWFDKQRIEAVQAWCWQRLRETLMYHSWSEIQPAKLRAWAERNTIAVEVLPKEYQVDE